MMIFKQITRPILIGWLLIAGALVVFFLVLREKKPEATPSDARKASAAQVPAGASAHQPSNPARRERKSPPEGHLDPAASRRLEEQLEAGELGAIDEKLTALAEAHQLGLVAGVLKNWCREGRIEVAQWSLVYSESSDPDLSLTLSAEALSNPSDVIREMAAARLESRTGIRFPNTGEARAWLASQPAH